MSATPHFSATRLGAVARVLACLLAVVTVLAVALLPPFLHWSQQKEHWLSARSTAQDTVSLSHRQAFNGLASFYRLNNREDGVTTLQLSLDESDLRKLTARRNDALAQGWITSKHKQELPAALSVDGRRMNASVRLRGNQLDHLSADKWSLKVHLKQGARLNGVRRFSLQAPYTRSFQSEAIIADAMRSLGVLAPRIDYVILVINGQRIGIMQMTEEFDTPLLESQGRRFGPLLQLDDSRTWKMVRTTERYAQSSRNNNSGERFDKSVWWNLFTSWRTADLKAYGKYNKRKKREDLDAALSRWIAFANHQLKASDIFDIDAFVDFYIVCEYFSAHNLAQWLNARLHYNTLTARFEPIVYDADLHYKPMPDAPLTCLNPRNELARTLMQDHAFGARWAERIIELDKKITSDQFANFIAARDTYYRKKLATDYPWLPAFDFGMARRQCARLCGLNIGDFALPISGKRPLPKADTIQLKDLPPVVEAYIGEDEQGAYLTLRNRIHADVVVSSLAYENRFNQQLVPLIGQVEPHLGKTGSSEIGQSKLTQSKLTTSDADIGETVSGAAQLPMKLTPFQGATTGTRIDIAGTSITDNSNLSMQVDVDGLGTQHIALKPSRLPQSVAIPQSMAVEQLLQRYSFLTLDESGKALQVASGQWKIDDLVIVPRGVALVINVDTQLLFAPDAGLVLNGDLTVQGSASSPVLFDATDKASGWYGIFSHGTDSLITIKHAVINATRGFEIPGWRQPAGLLFHRSNAILENILVSGSCADDAINLIRSTVTIKHLQISNSCSDAIDIDASTGTLSRLDLHKSGGDLLDISDSTVSLTSSFFSSAGDKAISIGEASEVEISEITVSKSAIGLAVKDHSDVTVSKSKFASVKVGLMSFQKKAEYGPAFLNGRELEIDAAQKYILEEGSGITLDGEQLPITPFELSDFY